MGVKKGLSINKKANKDKVEESSKLLKSNEIKATEKKPVSKKTSPAKTHLKSKENLKKSQEPSQVIDNQVKEIDKTSKIDKKAIKQPKNDLKKLDSKEVELLSAPKTRKKKEVVVKVPMTKQQIIAKGMEARKTFTLTEDRYDEIKSYLTSRGDEYDVVISGTTEKIRLANKTYVPFNAENMIGSGYHLANMVKADVKQWLENSVRVDENAEINYFGDR